MRLETADLEANHFKAGRCCKPCRPRPQTDLEVLVWFAGRTPPLHPPAYSLRLELPTRAVVVLSWALSVDAAPTAPRRSRNPTASRRTAPLPVPLLGGLLSPEMPKAQS